MKKLFRALVLTLVVIPCVMLCVACGKNPPPVDPEPLTQTVINSAGFSSFKAVVNKFTAHTGNKTVVSDYTTSSISKLFAEDGAEITGSKYAEILGSSYNDMNSSFTERERLTYNATTGEFASRLYAKQANGSFVAQGDYSAVKKVGTKFVEYKKEGTNVDAGYVSDDHVLHSYFDYTMWSSNGLERTLGKNPSEFADFYEMCTYFEEGLIETFGDYGLEDISNSDFVAKFTTNNNIWTLNLGLDVDGETEENGVTCDMSILSEVTISFTDAGLRSYESNISVEVSADLPVDNDNYVYTSGFEMNAREVYTSSFDSSLKLKSSELAEFDGITLQNVYAKVALEDLFNKGTFNLASSGRYGESLANILDEYKAELGSNVDIKLYRDEERSVEFDYTTELAPSYELQLYVDIMPKTGYAVVIENRDLDVRELSGTRVVGYDECNIRVFSLDDNNSYTFLTTVDLLEDNGEFDDYDTEEWSSTTLDGIEIANNGDTITLESGKVYRIGYYLELVVANE